MADDEHPLFTEHKKWAIRVGSYVAYCLRRGFVGPWPLSYGEIINAALIGLMYAARDFKPGSVPFKAFASKRIKGAVIDEFRSRHRGLKTRRSMDKPHAQGGGFGPGCRDDSGNRRSSEPEAPYDTSTDRREADEVTEKLIDLVSGSKRKLVMRLYYIRSMTLLEIGGMIGLTESRICQLHAEGCRQLALKLQGRAADFIKLGGRK